MSLLSSCFALQEQSLTILAFCSYRLANAAEGGHLYGVHGSSGGYAEIIFRYAAKTLFGKEIVGPLNFKTIRNSDFKEVTLEVRPSFFIMFALTKK